MTRINVVPPAELCNKHLLAEMHELPRVFKLARPCAEAPKEYVLGTGHVKFFYNKLAWLSERFIALVEECQLRGFNITHTSPPSGAAALYGDYTPTQEALTLNRARIAERISQFKRK